MRAGPDPVALRSPALVRFFGAAMARAVRRDFHALRIARPGRPRLPEGRPAVIYLNHPSWWDPAVIAVLATRLFPERRSYGPIDAEALGRYRFMARIGLFGLEPGPRGAAAFLKAGERILSDPEAILWVTAEGRFTDPRTRPVRLMGGVAHLARRVGGAVLLPMAVEYPFWTERKPEALLRFGAPMASEQLAAMPPDQATRALERELEDTMDGLAAEAAARDPAAFETLLSGTVGVGGVYDLWRRARAWARGERFRPEHGGAER
jgi:1-acyl-sn-glycerol-3-phosphate acyltransferase